MIPRAGLLGDPDQVAALAGSLQARAEQLIGLADSLTGVAGRSPWSGAGRDAFEGNAAQLATRLRAGAARLQQAGEVLQTLVLAIVHAHEGLRTAEAGWEQSVAEHQRLCLARANLVDADSTAALTLLARIRDLEIRRDALARRAEEAWQGWLDADRAAASRLDAIAADSLADGWWYRRVAGTEQVSGALAWASGLLSFLPQMRATATVTTGVQLTAQATRMTLWGEGTREQWGAWVATVGLAGVGGAKQVFGGAAGAGASRSGAGTQSRWVAEPGAANWSATRRLGAGLRVSFDEYRAQWSTLPPWLTPKDAATAVGSAAKTTNPTPALTLAQRGRALLGKGLEKAKAYGDEHYADAWRRATAGGPIAQRYQAGAFTADALLKAKSASDQAAKLRDLRSGAAKRPEPALAPAG